MSKVSCTADSPEITQGCKAICVLVGDLTITGKFTLVAPLLVVGNLTVEGLLADSGPESVLAVTGNLTAKHVFTSGPVVVAGDVTIAQTLYGHYNDDAFEVLGTLAAARVISDDHQFIFDAARSRIQQTPVKPGPWGPKVFARNHATLEELQKLLPEGALFKDSEESIQLDEDLLFA